MMRYLTVEEVLTLHHMAIEEVGGSHGIRDLGSVESCVAQPQMTFGGQELYPTLADKAAILGFLLISNHPFVDGNKRVGYVAMRVFLELNQHELAGTHEEKERVILAVAASEMEQEDFFTWVREHVQSRTNTDNTP